jgi:hypothetical protein
MPLNPQPAPLYTSKTFWTGLISTIGAIGGYATGAVAPVEAIQLAVTGLTGMFLRQAINKQASGNL